MNFPNMYQDKLCQTCNLFPESQSHLMQCPPITPHLKLLSLPDISVEENHIYGDETRQLQIVKLYGKVLEIRRNFLEDNE